MMMTVMKKMMSMRAWRWYQGDKKDGRGKARSRQDSSGQVKDEIDG